MEKTQMIHNGVSKKVYATDEPDKVIIQYTDAITAYYKIKKALIKDKGLYCNAISSMIFKLLADSGVPVLSDDITPDSARFWDIETGMKLDKDRFRHDNGKVGQGYNTVYERLKAELNG